MTTDDKFLISHVRDLKNQCADNSMITNTSFLDLRQRSLLLPLEKENSSLVKTYYYGGYSSAERVCAVFVPSFYEIEDVEDYFFENSDENPLRLIRIDKDRFSALSHRDYLGSLMGLGLKRETVGDILPDESGCFVICTKNAAKFILENLLSVGKGSVEVSYAPLESLGEKKEQFEIIGAFIASARVDNFVSAAFNVSRSAAVSLIEKSVVYVNGGLCEKPDMKLSPGDKVVARGKGKVIFDSTDGQSKKGRLHITIKKYTS